MKSIMEEASSVAKAIETAWNRAGQPTEFTVKVLELPQTSFFGLKTSKSAKVAFFFNEATVTVKPKDSGRTESDRQQRHGQQRPVTLRQTSGKEHDQRRGQSQRPDRSDARDNRQEARHDRGQQRRPEHAKSNTERPDFHKSSEPRPHNSYKTPAEATASQAPSEHGAHSAEARQEHRPERRERHDDRPRRHDERRQRHSDYSKYADRDGERSERSYSSEPRENWSPEMAEVALEWIKETLVLMGKSDISISHHISQNYLKVALSAPVLEDARQEETQLKSWGMLAMEAVREKAGKPLRSLRIILESPKQ